MLRRLQRIEHLFFIPIISIATSMFMIVTAPVVIGMLFNKFASNFSKLFEPFAKKISIGLFVIVLLGAIVSERDNIISYNK